MTSQLVRKVPMENESNISLGGTISLLALSLQTIFLYQSAHFVGRERGCVGDSVGRLVIISIVRKGHQEKTEHSNVDYSMLDVCCQKILFSLSP